MANTIVKTSVRSLSLFAGSRVVTATTKDIRRSAATLKSEVTQQKRVLGEKSLFNGGDSRTKNK